MTQEIQLFRTAFENDNARNIGVQELGKQFVWTTGFERLLRPKNHVVLGARGSGKTALVKMLSHQYLSAFDDSRAKKLVKQKLCIGIYVPMKLEWVGGLKNKNWMDDSESENFFQWRLNIATCISFLSTLNSCLKQYTKDDAQRILLERRIIKELSESLIDNEIQPTSINELRIALEDIEFDKQRQLIRNRVSSEDRKKELIGASFETELFTPLRRSISIAKRYIDFEEHTKWFLCLDEAEFLSESHHRILNSHLRTNSGDLVFKITTMPYHHHTIETNTAVPLTVGDDFDYVYIDQPITEDSIEAIKTTTEFTRQLFKKRLPVVTDETGMNLKFLLGPSVLLDESDTDWDYGSHIWDLLLKYSNDATISRAERKKNDPGFKNEIARKMEGMLLLRESLEIEGGRRKISVYSGESVFIRCGDGNPRRIIRLMNQIMQSAQVRESSDHRVLGFVPLSKQKQNSILLSNASSTLNLAKLEPVVGDKLFKLVDTAGTYMKSIIAERSLSTDHVSSIELSNVDDSTWLLITKAVAWGLMFPNINPSNPDPLPFKEGKFRLAFGLSPYFRIMPRKGKSVSLSTVLKQMELF